VSRYLLLLFQRTDVQHSRGTSFTYFPDTKQGDDRWNFFKQVIDFHPITTLNVLDWNISAAPSHFVLALFTFLYVDIIDCTATLYSMARFSGVVDPDTGDFPRSTLAYCTDALCISVGSLLGVSPVTAFIESGAGIAEGGKTGLTAMTCGLCFFISMFFAPIFASIPPWATGCTLILVSNITEIAPCLDPNCSQVGCLMMRQIVMINWRYIGDAVPAFVTVMFIPFGYSAAYGLIAGILVYTVLNGLIYITKIVSRGQLVPDDEDHREYWTGECSNWSTLIAELNMHAVKPHGRLPWFITASQSIVSHFGHGSTHDLKQDSTSLKSGNSQEQFRSRSQDMNRELDTVVVMPRDPRDEKVFRKT
jgi:AGZA family xanthine/uracil permease-like MFS transporter